MLFPNTLHQTYHLFGQNQNINLKISKSKDLSGIIAGLSINGVNVIESRSAAGAAWQTSYIISALNDKDIYVLNQASGNAVGFQWGFDNLKPTAIWNKIYSDHRHPNGDFANTEPPLSL